MNSEELCKAVKKSNIILIPVGATEQHGPHLPLFTDSIIAYEVAKRAADKISSEFPVVVAPLIPFGKSTENIDLVGTISLRVGTFINLIRDICTSLTRHGFKKLVIVNGHGGNTQLLSSITMDIAKKTGCLVVVFDWWQTDLLDDVKSKIQESKEAGIFHAGEMETSIMMYLRPNTVVKDKLQESYPSKFTKDTGFRYLLIENPHYISGFSWFFKDISNSGTVGDPTKSSEEKGKIFINKMVDRLCEVLREVRTV